jgi:nucleoside-diphosphate-sugar epimerase
VKLVTGANGFLGWAVTQALVDKGIPLLAAVRKSDDLGQNKAPTISVGDIGPDTEWSHALDGIDTIIHTAARVHVMRDSIEDPLSEYRKVNVEGTLNLARQAVKQRVKRFVFISSIKVNGESTAPELPFTADDHARPLDPYGISKCEAEVGLRQLAKEAGIELVIIRPPLVYGPGVRANFLSIIRWVNMGVPLPLGAIHNKRSLVALDNLVDLIVTCTVHPAAANQTFLAGDGEDLSTTELFQRIGNALDKPARLIPFPATLVKFAASLLGKKAVAERLCGSLQVDISKTRKLLGWEPPISVDEGLRRTVKNYLMSS